MIDNPNNFADYCVLCNKLKLPFELHPCTRKTLIKGEWVQKQELMCTDCQEKLNEDKDKMEGFCKDCDWRGDPNDCKSKTYGAYCGHGDNDEDWGWEEWDNLACPVCGKEIQIEEDKGKTFNDDYAIS